MSGSDVHVTVTMGDVILLLETVHALLMTEFLRRMDGHYTDSSREAALRFTLALADKLRFVQANLDLDDATRKEGLPLDEEFGDLAVTFKEKALQLEAAVVDLTEHLVSCVARRESETRRLRTLQDLEREREVPLMGHTTHPTDRPVAQLPTQLPTEGAADSNPRHDTIDSSRYIDSNPLRGILGPVSSPLYDLFANYLLGGPALAPGFTRVRYQCVSSFSPISSYYHLNRLLTTMPLFFQRCNRIIHVDVLDPPQPGEVEELLRQEVASCTDARPQQHRDYTVLDFVVGLVGDAVSFVGMFLVLGLLFLLTGFLWYAIWAAMTNGLPRMRGH